MKNMIIFLLALLALNGVNAQGCLPEGIRFTSQAQVDSFPINYPGCTYIEGNVQIGPALNHWLTDITDLHGLNSLNYIGGSLGIFCNPLSSLSGLENLNYIGGIFQIGRLNYPYLEGNPNLGTMAGLDGLDSIGGDLIISYNQGLTSLTGLEGLTVIRGNLTIGKPCNTMWGGNPSLINLTGLNNLTDVQSVIINSNSSLTSLTGLEGLSLIKGSLSIQGNSSLFDLTGLNNLSSVIVSLVIGYNDTLANLSGLENLESIGSSLAVYENDQLINLSGLENLDSIGGCLTIGGIWDVGDPIPPGGNDLLENLIPLENLHYVGEGIEIGKNISLTSLAGLNYINAGSVTDLTIRCNFSLSNCEVQSVCDYLSSPNGTVWIEYNSTGCNSSEEILSACQVGVRNEQETGFKIFPNPSNGLITITIPPNSAPANLAILDFSGQEMLRQTITDPVFQLDISNLPAGMYLFRFKNDHTVETGRFIKQ
jgi:hypothetical protein